MGELTAIAERFSARHSRNRFASWAPDVLSHEVEPDAGYHFDFVGSHVPAQPGWPAQPQGGADRQRSLLMQLLGASDQNADANVNLLLKEFGSIGGVFGASPAALLRVIGRSPAIAVLVAARETVTESLRETVIREAFDPRQAAIQKYILVKMSGLRDEHLRAFFLTSSYQYLGDETHGRGSLAGISLSIRPLFRRALELNAATLVLVHNHPSKQLQPSAADREFTNKVTEIGKALEISIADHLIVAGGRIFSMARGKVL